MDEPHCNALLTDRMVGIANFRDLGGTPTTDGRFLRRRMLLRSASLAGATATDVALLQDARVLDVVDLRADWEVATAGPVPDAFRTHRLALVPDAARDETYEVLREAGLAGYYFWILQYACAELVRLVEIVAEAPAGVLVQCGAGKDRTGVAIAVLLDLLGVDDDAIAADFARTAQALRAIRDGLARTPGYGRALEELPPEVLRAPPLALLEALGTLRAAHGSMAEYLAAAGLGAATAAALRARLIVCARGAVEG